jgi:pyrroloquinoline quinone (PQQ) biosynthesis protein C
MQIKQLLTSQHPKVSEMAFMRELTSGKFQREEILRSEVVELYRALDTREKIQNIYKTKLSEGIKNGLLADNELSLMTEVIDDEGETKDHIDHLDMRFKLFGGTGIKRGKFPKKNNELQKINDEWVNICKEASLFEIMSCHCAIEGWYPQVSTMFETEYKKRGFKNEELEIFIAHQGADVEHSEAQYGILEKNYSKLDVSRIEEMVKRTFATSRAYEVMKLNFANSDKPLDHFFE